MQLEKQPLNCKGPNNDKSTAETIFKTNEHHPSTKLIKEHIQKENNDFDIKLLVLDKLTK